MRRSGNGRKNTLVTRLTASRSRSDEFRRNWRPLRLPKIHRPPPFTASKNSDGATIGHYFIARHPLKFLHSGTGLALSFAFMEAHPPHACTALERAPIAARHGADSLAI